LNEEPDFGKIVEKIIEYLSFIFVYFFSFDLPDNERLSGFLNEYFSTNYIKIKKLNYCFPFNWRNLFI
jgi:hypothetical protein